ncbi:MAG: hypothetical protein QM632_06245 [Micrococcaceae bacterium]
MPELYALTNLTHSQYQSVQRQAMETYKSFTAILVKAVHNEIYKVKSVDEDSEAKEDYYKELYTANLKQE